MRDHLLSILAQQDILTKSEALVPRVLKLLQGMVLVGAAIWLIKDFAHSRATLGRVVGIILLAGVSIWAIGAPNVISAGWDTLFG